MARAAFTLFLLLLVAAFAFAATRLSAPARLAPLAVAPPTLALLLLELGRDLRRARRTPRPAAGTRPLPVLGQIAALVLLVWAFGAALAIPAVVALQLRLVGRTSALGAVGGGLLMLLAVTLARLAGVHLPEGAIAAWLAGR
ncbi:MAG TPA: hypothetical protein ENJ38_05045 [Rhodospirillales bacterium]|nr:hypothetical protein [Rhodospirillales bacterium]